MARAVLAALALALCQAAAVRAGLLLEDSFSYADGDLDTASANSWSNTVAGPKILQVASGKVLHDWTTTDGSNDRSSYEAEHGGSGILYASFVLNVTTAPAFSSGTYVAGFSTGSGPTRARVWVGEGAVSSSDFRLGLTGSSGTSSEVQWLPDLPAGADTLVVTRYDSATGDVELWIDPAAETDPSVTDTSTALSRGAYALSIRDNVSGTAGVYGTFTFDDLKIGTAFADVLPPNTNVIPHVEITVTNAIAIDLVATPGGSYELEYATQMTSSNWTGSGHVLVGDGTVQTLYDPTPDSLIRGYRMVAGP